MIACVRVASLWRGGGEQGVVVVVVGLCDGIVRSLGPYLLPSNHLPNPCAQPPALRARAWRKKGLQLEDLLFFSPPPLIMVHKQLCPSTLPVGGVAANCHVATMPARVKECNHERQPGGNRTRRHYVFICRDT